MRSGSFTVRNLLNKQYRKKEVHSIKWKINLFSKVSTYTHLETPVCKFDKNRKKMKNALYATRQLL